MKLLVTGGAGYIGSHFVRKALKEHDVTIIDNLSRGNKASIPEGILFKELDILNEENLDVFFSENKFDAIVHFAAFAYVGESVKYPDIYYKNNVEGSLNLISTAKKYNIDKFIFSSTCSIYGNTDKLPISESNIPAPINPYAKTKFFIENILQDFSNAFGMKYVSLRYFNAAGASMEYNIGESHNPETHLIPLVLESTTGNYKLKIFGNDYNTEDGTCVRDYIHVDDLADAHLAALNYICNNNDSKIINLGTGKGNSILEIIKTTEKITGQKVNFEYHGKREGDPAILIADNSLAKKLLNWEPKYDIDDIISSAWNWFNNKRY